MPQFYKSEIDLALSTSSKTKCSDTCSCNDITRDFESFKRYDKDRRLQSKDYPNKLRVRKARDNNPLTNFDLYNLENRIFKNISQELIIDESSYSSLDIKIKLLKITVNEIFGKFYAYLSDFEHCKRRFEEVIDMNNERSADDIEDIIKNIINHVSSDLQNNMSYPSSCGDTELMTATKIAVIEAYKNKSYHTDSTLDDNATIKRSMELKEIFNIIEGRSQSVETKLEGRTIWSDFNIKRPTEKIAAASAASTNNMIKVSKKKTEVEKYETLLHDANAPDKHIPVKISFAKKNIHLGEDFGYADDNVITSKSFLVKLCNLVCRKFRKSIFG